MVKRIPFLDKEAILAGKMGWKSVSGRCNEELTINHSGIKVCVLQPDGNIAIKDCAWNGLSRPSFIDVPVITPTSGAANTTKFVQTYDERTAKAVLIRASIAYKDLRAVNMVAISRKALYLRPWILRMFQVHLQCSISIMALKKQLKTTINWPIRASIYRIREISIPDSEKGLRFSICNKIYCSSAGHVLLCDYSLRAEQSHQSSYDHLF